MDMPVPGPGKIRPLAAWLVLLVLACPAGAQNGVEEFATFRRMIPGLDSTYMAKFNYGQGFFDHRWKSTPHADRTLSGLGPLYNATACDECHVRDGRGQPPGEHAPAVSGFVLKLGHPAEMAGATWTMDPDPVYGHQLQDGSIGGVPPEGRIDVSYAERTVLLSGGERAELRLPAFEIADLAYGPLSGDVAYGPRVAPPIFGLGYVESIDAADIMANADGSDANNDGISGRPNMVVDERTGRLVLGRFGWKASVPAIRQQAELAASLDMGLGSPATGGSAGDCTKAQTLCFASAAYGMDPEFGEKTAKLVEFYVRHLAVPASREAEYPDARRGGRLFADIGCAACHIPAFETSATAAPKHFASRTIHPYSDFLLHDMGEDLADGFAIGSAGRTEWRTPPLWGIGLTEAVNGHTYFLHDGRARNLQEAILWHGGEARQARERYRALDPTERAALLAFVSSL